MYNSVYLYQEYEILYIAEDSTSGKYPSRPEQPALKDDEIAAIRAALQKISRRRILNVSDAEDLVQDTLLTMITRNPGSELKKGILAWSRGILRNKVGNYYRKSRRHAFLKEKNCSVPQPALVSAKDASQETVLSNKELRAIIEDKLADFPPRLRHVMELLVSGLEAGEIVERLSPEPYQNVINRLYRGRKKMARELIKCGFGPISRHGKKRKSDRGNQAGVSRRAS